MTLMAAWQTTATRVKQLGRLFVNKQLPVLAANLPERTPLHAILVLLDMPDPSSAAGCFACQILQTTGPNLVGAATRCGDSARQPAGSMLKNNRT